MDYETKVLLYSRIHNVSIGEARRRFERRKKQSKLKPNIYGQRYLVTVRG